MNKLIRIILLGYYGFFIAFFAFASISVYLMFQNGVHENLNISLLGIWVLHTLIYIFMFYFLLNNKLSLFKYIVIISTALLALTTFHRFFYITERTLDSVDLNNAIIYFIPVILYIPVYLKKNNLK